MQVMVNLDELDPVSQEFLKKVEKTLEDKDAFYDRVDKLLCEMYDFFHNTPYEQLREWQLMKMRAGAKEYGQLETSKKKVRKQKVGEFLDLTGWDFVEENAENE